jgi:putative exporter of polyketide antibiotics
MRNTVLVIVGILLAFFGAIFTFQGLGYLPGSAMTGVTLWAILGPIIAIIGLIALGIGIAGFRRRSS